MLKPSIKSVEGVSQIGYYIAGVVILYEVLTGHKVSIDTDELLKQAKTVDDIVKAYHAAQPSFPDTIARLGAAGGILTFLYKVYTSFLGARKELKAKELEAIISTAKSMNKVQTTIINEDANMKTISKQKAAAGLSIVFLFILISGSYCNGLAASARFSWLPNTETDLAGYTIVWGAEENNYTNEYDCHLPETQSDGRVYCTVPEAPDGITYFAAYAYDSNGNKSEPCIPIQADLAPSTPTEFTIIVPTGTVVNVNSN